MPKIRYRDIVDQINIDAFEDAIGFEVTLQRGDNDCGQCPDIWGLHKHGDTTGKFAIHRIKRVWNCFVCGGGSLLSLVMAMYNMTEIEAIDWLAQYAGEGSNEDFEDEIERLMAEDNRRRDPIVPWFNERVIESWVKDIHEAREWLQDRGISAQVAREFKLGFNPSTTRGDREGETIIFPHFWEGRLVGWQERWFDGGKPKYTNTTDFPRRWTIYNYERVYLSEDPIVVVESVPTVLFLASQGIPAVATFGASVTPEQQTLLRRCQQGLILAPDNDKAGEKWERDLGRYLERFVDLKVAPVVDGEGSDFGDLAVEPSLVKPALEAAVYPTYN